MALEPEAALALWTDPSRWATFVEGFARVLERDEDWPAEGAKVVWESMPDGRGRVTEKVVEQRARPAIRDPGLRGRACTAARRPASSRRAGFAAASSSTS